MDPQTWFQSLPLITQSWFGASLLVNIAATMDVLNPDDLYFDWHLIKDNLELWRIATSFLYAGGSMHEFHVLILLYLIPIHSKGYEQNPYPTGGTPRADYGYCMVCCILLILGSFVLLDKNEDSILSMISSATGMRFKRHYMLLYPLFTRTLVTSIMYLWSRRNPNVNVQLNFVPIPGQYLPFAHVGLALMLGNRINELIHGILVGHVYYYLVEVVPAVTGGRRILTTPTIFVQLLEGGGGGEVRDNRQVRQQHQHRPRGINNNNNNYSDETYTRLMRTFQRDGASITHVAAKLGDLVKLRELSNSGLGRASFAGNDNNGWKPLHEAVRGGHIDVVRFLLLERFGDIVDVNARTGRFGSGPNALWIAETTHGRDHPVTVYLRDVAGVESLGPQQQAQPAQQQTQQAPDQDDEESEEEEEEEISEDRREQ